MELIEYNRIISHFVISYSFGESTAEEYDNCNMWQRNKKIATIGNHTQLINKLSAPNAISEHIEEALNENS